MKGRSSTPGRPSKIPARNLRACARSSGRCGAGPVRSEGVELGALIERPSTLCALNVEGILGAHLPGLGLTVREATHHEEVALGRLCLPHEAVERPVCAGKCHEAPAVPCED